MKDPFDHIISLFTSKNLSYSLTLDREIISSRLNDFFFKHNEYPTTNDLNGFFTSPDTFEINVTSAFYTGGVKYSSTLIGKISKTDSEKTLIKISLKASIAVRILFFVFFVFGVIYFIKLILDIHLTSYLFWSAAMIAASFTIPVWVYKVSNAVLLDRFLKILRTLDKNYCC